MTLQLNAENYHSPEANWAFMSVSQYKEWLKCEAQTLATLRGEYEPEDKEALLVGGYVHAYFESAEAFTAYSEKYRDFILKPKGGKYAAFVKADEMIDCLRADPKVMFYLQGRSEVIQTVELFGIPWKFKIDKLNEELNYLLELKTTASITEPCWVVRDGKRQPATFVEGWGYMLQAAMLAEGERLHQGATNHRDVFCVAVSKESPPDHAIINLSDPERFKAELAAVQEKLPGIIRVKNGEQAPARCGTCKYCRATKRVDRVIHYTELQPA